MSPLGKIDNKCPEYLRRDYPNCRNRNENGDCMEKILVNSYRGKDEE